MATLSLSGSCVLKAGTNVSSEFTGTNAEDNWNDLIAMVEGVICAVSRYDWVNEYSGLDDNVKHILEDICSNLAAIYAISYDMSGFTTRIEAEDMITVLRDAALRGLSLLRDQKVVSFLKNET